MTPEAYLAADATELAARVAAGDVTPDDLLTLALEQVGRWNPTLNAVVWLDEGFARDLIRTGPPASKPAGPPASTPDIPAELPADGPPADPSANPSRGPFHGVPFLLKDIGCETPEFPVSNGSRLSLGTRYARNATVYDRFRAAGLIPFARTTCPEGAVGPVTEAVVYGGPTRNPWDSGRTPGGSSGGAAAAVAAGIVPAAHGSDGGGSIRIPASCCGLVGFKPSRARIPDGPYAGEGWAGMAQDGVLTRSVRDTAALLDVMSGPDLGVPYYPPPMAGTYLEASARSPGRLRIAICTTTLDGAPIHADCAAGVERTAALLSDMGHRVASARPEADLPAMMAAWTRIVACGTASWVRAVAAKKGVTDLSDLIEPATQGALDLARGISGSDYLEAVNTVHAFGREMAAFFLDHDVLVTATLAEPPAEIGRFAHSRPEFRDFMAYRTGPEGVFAFSPFCAAFNASGQPAMSLPLHRTAEGLPIGVHFAAAMGGDEMLMSLAGRLEQAAPWAHLRPTPPA